MQSAYLLTTLLFIINIISVYKNYDEPFSILSLLILHINFIRIEKIHRKIFSLIYIPSIISLIIYATLYPLKSFINSLYSTLLVTSFISNIFFSIKGFTLWDKGGIKINTRIFDFILIIYYLMISFKSFSMLPIWILIISTSSSFLMKELLL